MLWLTRREHRHPRAFPALSQPAGLSPFWVRGRNRPMESRRVHGNPVIWRVRVSKGWGGHEYMPTLPGYLLLLTEYI
jgi:hypothetical protein